MSDIQALPAFERTQTAAPPVPPGRRVPAWRAAAAAVVLALVVGLAAWWFRPGPTQAGDLLEVLTEEAADFVPEQRTTDPEQARTFILETLGWSVAPPDLPSLALVGVGVPSIGSIRETSASAPADVQVPAFRYEGVAGARAILYAYDYILLDRVRAQMDVPEGTYAALSEPTPVDSRVVGGVYVVTWRARAMIFSAITDNEEVADQIRQAVSA